MSEGYDLYRSTRSLANAIVKQSKGLGPSSFDTEKVMKDVAKASGISDVADKYWVSMQRAHDATERHRAAKVLDLDLAKYEAEMNEAEAVREAYIQKMKEITSEYQKDWNGNWRI